MCQFVTSPGHFFNTVDPVFGFNDLRILSAVAAPPPQTERFAPIYMAFLVKLHRCIYLEISGGLLAF